MLHRQGRRGSGIRLAVVIAALLVGALPATASADTPYALGLAGPDTQTGATALDAPMTVPASVPATVDLTPFAPPAGNQGGVNSCAAWAVDYTALGYWENKQGIAGGRLAPMYTYSQLVHGVNTGTYIDDHLTIATQQGVDNRTDYSQGDYDYTNLPTAQETLNAVHWQLSGFTDLPVVQNAAGTTTEQSIEGALAAGDAGRDRAPGVPELLLRIERQPRLLRGRVRRLRRQSRRDRAGLRRDRPADREPVGRGVG